MSGAHYYSVLGDRLGKGLGLGILDTPHNCTKNEEVHKTVLSDRFVLLEEDSCVKFTFDK